MAIITKTPKETLSDLLRTLKGGFLSVGVENPKLDPGTDIYVEAQAYSNEFSIAANNVNELSDQLMSDTAIGEDLDRILTIFGLSRRGASQASGFIEIVCTTTTFVVVGSQLTANNGLVYEVTIGGSYSNGDTIPVTSVDSGSNTNLAVDEVLVWTDTPAFTQTTATVYQAITGGVDAEDDETARQRLLDRLRNPPSLGNWQQVAELSERFDPVVQKAFIYPVANGPGTLHIALTGYTSDVSKSRAIADTKITDLTSAIQGQLPEYIESVITTVDDVEVDVSFALTLPYPEGNINLGTGGGWLNFNPWPLAFNQSGLKKSYVSSVTSNTSFTVTTLATNVSVGSLTGYLPIANLSKISWIEKSSDGWVVRTATVTAVNSDGSTGEFDIEIDTPFVGVAVDDLIFPAATNSQVYLDAVLSHFELMGPGEKIDASGLLPRGSRKPRSGLGFPNQIDGQLLRTVIESSDEVLSAAFLTREKSEELGVDITTSAPNIPDTISDSPKIYIPKRIAFYPTQA